MIQIIGYRYALNPRTKSKQTVTEFFNRQWRSDSVPDLFAKIDEFVSQIPSNERYNIHYTIARCHEKKGRILRKQTTIPWDIDGIDVSKVDTYHDVVLTVLGMKFDQVGIVFSGNGLHYLIESDIAIVDATYFASTKTQYLIIADKINLALQENGLPGKVDTTIWTAGHTLRLPNTENRKTEAEGYAGKNSITQCYLIQHKMVIQHGYAMHLQETLAIPNEGEAITPSQAQRFTSVDTDAVLQGCLFLQHCKTHAAILPEPQWHSMISILCRLDDGIELCHEYSQKHPGYRMAEVEMKIRHSLSLTGPHLCKTIDRKWGGCKDCPHNNTVSTPLLIKDPDFIATKDTGFYNMVYDSKTGEMKVGKPNFDDLFKFYCQQNTYVSDSHDCLFIWNGVHWEFMSDKIVKMFAEQNFSPKPTSSMCKEFLEKVQRNNFREKVWFEESTDKKINLKNGVLDFSKGYPQLLTSSHDISFMYSANYEYDPKATCPTFDRFMKEVTCNQQDISDFLLEYVAYALMDIECKEQLAVVLLGDGANGKSTFIEVVKALVGKKAYSILNLDQIRNDQQAASLQGKLFNLSEETPKESFVESSHFKNIVSGGEIAVKVVYKEPFNIRNRAKLIVAANSMPDTKDSSHGFYRRFRIVPFKARFNRANMDKHLKDKLLAELPGILNRVLEAFERYTNQRGFTEAGAITEAAEEYKNSQSLDDFFGDLIVITPSPKDYVTITDIYDAYLSFCNKERIEYPKSPKVFGSMLKNWLMDRGHDAHRLKTPRTAGEVRTYCYQGLKLVIKPRF